MKKLLITLGLGLGMGMSAATFAAPSCTSLCELADYYCGGAGTTDFQTCAKYMEPCVRCTDGGWI